MEKLGSFCTIGGNIKWYSCYGKQYSCSSKINKSRIPIWHQNSTPGNIPKELKAGT
jgi:hypothetical protein